MLEKLPPRERQLVDALYANGEASAAELRQALPDPLSDSAVRAMLSRLERKGYVRRRVDEHRFIYSPVMREDKAARSALRQVITSFFSGSPLGAATALVGMVDEVDPKELEALNSAIERARSREKK